VDYGKLPQQVLMDAILMIFLTHPSLHTRTTREIVWEGTSKPVPDWVPKLASYMDCTRPQRASLEIMLGALWHEERLMCFNGYGCPITDMGFEPAETNQQSIDRRWFEFQGERYNVECIHPAKIGWLNSKTARLLSVSWLKYLPRVDQLSQALEREHQAWQRVTGGKIDSGYSPALPQKRLETRIGSSYTNKMAPHYPIP
jgi:hypothetical protein